MRNPLILVFTMAASLALADERLEVGFQVPIHSISELEVEDVGLGGRLAFHPSSFFAIEGELNVYPRNLPSENPATSSRLEGLAGIKAGPRLGRLGLFARARPGFLRFGKAPGPLACIAIFPPPLECVLAEGRTLFALDVGGGVEIFATESTVVRVDVSSLIVRYPGPALTRSGEAFESDGFYRGNLRITLGAGFRF